MQASVWIALVHVKAKSKKTALSIGAKGAYTNALALARDAREFGEMVTAHAQRYGLDVVEIEDAETFEQRAAAYELSSELHEIAESVLRSSEVRFDAFYNYFTEDVQ